MNMMEEGEATTRPLLLVNGIKHHDNSGQSSAHNSSNSSSSSPVTLVVVFSTFIVYCSSFAFGNVIGYSSPAESGIINDLGLTLSEYSFFVSIYVIGSIIGGIWSGKTADVIGRRGALAVSNLLCITGWFATAFSKAPWSLDVGRFLVGFGMGFTAYTVPIYLAEITPKDVRGTFMSMTPLIISCGKAFFFVIGTLVNWRTLALIALVPYMLQLLGLLFIPDSPRWLIKINQVEKSQNALYRLRGEKADISQELADIKDYTEYCKRSFGDGIRSLFQREYAHILIIGVGLMVFGQFGGINGISFYTSTILDSAGFSSKIGSIVIGVTQIFAAILGICFIDKFGRRPILLISAIGTCLGCILLGLSFFFQNILQFGEEYIPALALVSLLVYFSCYSIGIEGIPWIIVSEGFVIHIYHLWFHYQILPINIKSPAGSILNVISSVSGWIISYSFRFIFEWNSAGTFFTFAGISGVSILFIWKMVPETKGRALEELQASISHGPQ